MSKSKDLQEKKKIPLSQVKKGVEQLSDAQLKERTRVYIPSAIARLAELCNATNLNVALGAIKVLLAKNIPDLKSTDVTSGGDKIQGIDVGSLLDKAYGIKSTTTKEVHPDSDKV